MNKRTTRKRKSLAIKNHRTADMESGGIGIRLRKLAVAPLTLDIVITSEASESLTRLAHGGTATSSELSNTSFARQIGMGSEPKPDKTTIWGTGMAVFPPICVT